MQSMAITEVGRGCSCLIGIEVVAARLIIEQTQDPAEECMKSAFARSIHCASMLSVLHVNF